MSHQTNTAESNHNRSYGFTGRYLPILTCILKNSNLDQSAINQCATFETYGTSSGYRAVSQESRMTQQIRKARKLWVLIIE